LTKSCFAEAIKKAGVIPHLHSAEPRRLTHQLATRLNRDAIWLVILHRGQYMLPSRCDG